MTFVFSLSSLYLFIFIILLHFYALLYHRFFFIIPDCRIDGSGSGRKRRKLNKSVYCTNHGTSWLLLAPLRKKFCEHGKYVEMSFDRGSTYDVIVCVTNWWWSTSIPIADKVHFNSSSGKGDHGKAWNNTAGARNTSAGEVGVDDFVGPKSNEDDKARRGSRRSLNNTPAEQPKSWKPQL